MNGEFQHNTAHAIGTCAKCGEEMAYNVPRLGPNGGYVHKATGSYECKTVAAPSGTAPVEVRCSEWMDALAENYARTAEAIFNDPRLTREGKLTGVRMLFLEARRLPESASIEKLSHCDEKGE